jgi:hypothetical protein
LAAGGAGRARAAHHDADPERGMVTAELAVALPSVVLVALLALSGVQVAMTQVRCLDAAGVAARLAARGEAADVVAAAVSTTEGDASTHLSISREGDLVEASVGAQVRLLGIGRLLPALTVHETAASVAEGETP